MQLKYSVLQYTIGALSIIYFVAHMGRLLRLICTFNFCLVPPSQRLCGKGPIVFNTVLVVSVNTITLQLFKQDRFVTFSAHHTMVKSSYQLVNGCSDA